MSDPFGMTPGGAYRIRSAYESGPPEVVTVRSNVATRAQYVRMQYFGDELVAVFKDPRTGEFYAQIAE